MHWAAQPAWPCRDHLALDVKNRRPQKTLSGRALLGMLYSKINQPEASLSTERRKEKVLIELPDLLCGMAKWKNPCSPLKLGCAKIWRKKSFLLSKCFIVSQYWSKKDKRPKDYFYVYKNFKSHNSLPPTKTYSTHTNYSKKRKIKGKKKEKLSLFYSSASKIMTSPVLSCDSELYTAQQRPRICR